MTWAPQECTLPTVERPVREAEFDAVLAEHVSGVERGPNRVVFGLTPRAEVAARVADLAVREAGCCGFFTFVFTVAAGSLSLEVSVAPEHAAVLDALADRAAATMGA